MCVCLSTTQKSMRARRAIRPCRARVNGENTHKRCAQRERVRATPRTHWGPTGTEKTTGTRLPLAETSKWSRGGHRAKSTGTRCPTEPTHSCRAAAAAVASLFMRRLTRSSWPWARRLKTWQPQRSERELRHRQTPRRRRGSNRSGQARSMNK